MKKIKAPVKPKKETAADMLSNSGFGWMVKNILGQIFWLGKYSEKRKKEIVENEKKTKMIHKILKKKHGTWVWRQPD